MILLQSSDEQTVVQFARQLLNEYRDNLTSFEEAAQVVTDTIHDEFRQPDGNRLFALLRIFRFGARNDIHPELQALATADADFWLTLMASKGAESNWCDRRTSEGHQVIPADSPATPMLQAAFAQIGLDFGQEIASGGLDIQRDQAHRCVSRTCNNSGLKIKEDLARRVG